MYKLIGGGRSKIVLYDSPVPLVTSSKVNSVNLEFRNFNSLAGGGLLFLHRKPRFKRRMHRLFFHSFFQGFCGLIFKFFNKSMLLIKISFRNKNYSKLVGKGGHASENFVSKQRRHFTLFTTVAWTRKGRQATPVALLIHNLLTCGKALTVSAAFKASGKRS